MNPGATPSVRAIVEALSVGAVLSTVALKLAGVELFEALSVAVTV